MFYSCALIELNSYLMEAKGKLKVRAYKTLERVMKSKSWEPFLTSIALHLCVHEYTALFHTE